MKSITVREAYDWLVVDEHLTMIEWENLLNFLEEKYREENVVEIGNRRLRFINLVGMIQLKTVRIEILPKLELSGESSVFNRRALLNMLSVTKQFPVQLNEQTTSKFESANLSHLIAYMFVSELYKALKRGIYREYEQKQENLKHLKGRLLVPQHIRKNVYQSVNAYCEYEELSPNIPLNQVLKAALRKIYPYIQDNALKTQAMMIFELLYEVADVSADNNMIDRISLNRQNQHYEGVLSLAVSILRSTMMSSAVSDQIAFSFLLKMNDLYEAYVGECLKIIVTPTAHKLDLQHKEKRLLVNVHSGRENIILKPDFVISALEDTGSIPVVIMDTKWKSIISGSRLTYNQADIYQMYAYITAYQSAERCILLYPKVSEEAVLPKWRVPDVFPEKYIELKMIRLDKVENTIEDLRTVLQFTTEVNRSD